MKHGTGLLLVLFLTGAVAAADDKGLLAGVAEVDITPAVDKKPVYMAGFGQNRKATGVHDKLYARAVVLKDGDRKIALVCVDLVGFFHQDAQKVRGKLKGFDHVLVSSTHNHEGPDTLGLWGPSPFKSGVDPDYITQVVDGCVKAIEDADKVAGKVTAKIGTLKVPELLHDSRKPLVLHDDLVVLQFTAAGKTTGLLVQWNCHPETMDDKNKQITSDYVGATVEYLKKKHNCPVAYFSGTVGGLMSSLKVTVKDDKGTELKDGTWEKTEKYGQVLGAAADKALQNAKPITLTPLAVKTRPIYLPIDNKLYQLAWTTGVLKRDAFIWTGDPDKAAPLDPKDTSKAMCIRTEVGWLQLGELSVACIPGEIYPELVLDKVQDPVDPGADFPKAAIEPSIYKQMPGPHRMLIGLANDEIGYLIPKRQWDQVEPFCYGLKKTQYGEINSLGPETAPLLCDSFRKLVTGK